MLLNINEQRGFPIYAADGEIGREDCSWLDEEVWQILYLVWATVMIKVQVARAISQNAPAYDKPATITRAYEERLFTRYNKTAHWRAVSSDRTSSAARC